MEQKQKALDKKEKKAFNKKKWKERTFSNKFKVQQWEQRRQRNVIREYQKELKFSAHDNKGRKPPAYTLDDQTQSDVPVPVKKRSAMQQARDEMERRRLEKIKRIEDLKKQKEEREEALRKYRAAKAERYKRLSKKTKKGQPVMKDRLEMLLEKIQKQCTSLDQ